MFLSYDFFPHPSLDGRYKVNLSSALAPLSLYFQQDSHRDTKKIRFLQKTSRLLTA
jgi:hypothetical protein